MQQTTNSNWRVSSKKTTVLENRINAYSKDKKLGKRNK